MLKLIDITKNYQMADTTIRALNGVTLSFRPNEFVAVLGPSGCGKTTLLNIIGGLDKYTTGDLFINGCSTKNFKDSDWDVHRNHRVGFVFQTYNLIPHQTVLENVELALTIAGMEKTERVEKAKKALDKVGLSDQYNKRPNQLSGGQSQRVAIARALVNDPEILLADEPTGALDTATSHQIMELVKEIAQDRLVIMVTHNADLAEKYSTRIIRLLDGCLQSDSLPAAQDEQYRPKSLVRISERSGKKEKAQMSLGTAFKLSFQNLLSKRSRTILTSVASSIGIIGISLVLSISYGMQMYITHMQNDMLSGNPIIITETAFDISKLMSMSGNRDQIEVVFQNGFVNVDAMIEAVAKRAAQAGELLINNKITQEYVDYVLAMPSEYVAAIFLDYGIDIANNFYVDIFEYEGAPAQNISLSTLRTIYTAILQQNEATKHYASMITQLYNSFLQAPDSIEYILMQYDVLDGRMASGINEIMIVLNQDRMITDLLLAQLGYYTQAEFTNLIYKATGDDRYDYSLPNKPKISYEELMGHTFIWYPNDTVFNQQPGNTLNPFTYNAYSQNFKVLDSGAIELTIVGILQPKEDMSYGSLTSGFYYTEALTKHMLDTSLQSQIVQYMVENDLNTFSSMQFEIAPGILVNQGITFKYSYNYLGTHYENVTGFVGSINAMSSMFSNIFGGNSGDAPDIYTVSLRELGGKDIAYTISVFPLNLEQKKLTLAYLDVWNSEDDVVVNGIVIPSSERDEIIYTDSLSLIFNMIGRVITIITIALIGFTTLALIVSCVMIAIITYVSVMERVREIGVIRSLGGRKSDVANLFIAETAIIGLSSGLLAILFTYLASFAINLFVNPATGINIAVFPWFYAVLMVSLSVGLTLVSGFIPSRSAAKKDPVVALRTE